MAEKEMIEEQMTIDLENILPSLAQNLYGNDWRISIRELLQNCNDANIEARIADRDLQPPALPIRIIPNRGEGTLTIQDEGIGMTLKEVTDYLATVGSGKKRERLEEISRGRKSADYELIRDIVGQYGIGFLASFIIAKRVEVITKSRIADEPAQKCLFSGETKWYHLEHGGDTKPGTIIILHLKGEYKDPTGEIDLLNPAVLEEVVSKFGDLIPYHIYRCEKLNETGALLNCIDAPWERDAPMLHDFEDFFTRRFPGSNLPLVIEPFVFNNDQHKVEAKGIIYFPVGGSAVNNQLFVKRIFIKEQFAELLPEWASFVGVIVDCPDLTPTLDRNNVITHEQAFANLKLSLVDLIIEKLVEYATRRQDTFTRILQAHLWNLQIALIKDWDISEEGKEHFFRSLIDYMPFKVLSQNFPQGERMTLRDYRKNYSQSIIPQKDTGDSIRSDARDPIFYIHEPNARAQYEALVIKKNIPVISAHSELEYSLVKAYRGAFGEEVDAKNIRDFLDLYVKSDPIDQTAWECIINYYTELSGGPQTVKVAPFEPASMPGVLVVSEIDEQRAVKLEEFMRAGANILTPQLRRQMEDEVKRLQKGDTAFILYINTKNSLMNNIRRTITEVGRPSYLVAKLLEEVYHNAKTYANVASGVEENIFEHRTGLLDSVLSEDKELNQLKGERDKMLIEIKRLQIIEQRLQSIKQEQRECIDISSIPANPEPRYCATLLCDLTKSTWVLANIDFKDQGDIFNRYILGMKSVVEEHNGFFDKFTGDGLLAFFGLTKPDEVNDTVRRQICMDAKLCATEITAMTDAFFAQEDVRNVLQRQGIPAPQSCISLAAGEVAFGRFGGSGTAVGVPIVQAARIETAHIKKDGEKEEHRKFFKDNIRIICTAQFLTDLGTGIHQVPSLLLEENFGIDGSFPINVYKLS